MSDPCKFEKSIIEMHGNICSILTELKSMNGDMKGIVNRFCVHEKDSVGFRKKVDMIWAGVHIFAWIVVLIMGTGILFRFVGK